MQDFAGNELKRGQRVVYLTTGASSSWMLWGRVMDFTPKKVRIRSLGDEFKRRPTTTLRDPDNVVLAVLPPDVVECAASSWPFTVDDTKCLLDRGHEGQHLDINQFEW